MADLDLLFLTQGSASLPSVRFRVLPYVDASRSAGLRVDWRQVPNGAVPRSLFYLRLPEVETIVLQKKLVDAWELGLIRRRCRQLVFDFDDALWASHPGQRRDGHLAAREAKAARRLELICREADLVIAGNRTLAQHVAAWAGRVEVLPTPLDTSRYVPAAPRQPARERLTVGWMGTSCNLFFLPQVLTALEPLRDRIQVLLVSDEAYPGIAPFPLAFESWSAEAEISQLQRMDVGLMPLTDDVYTRGKCGFKILQYMACGAVPVASDVGFNAEILTHGQDGLLAREAKDWCRHVAALADDLGLRTRLAQAARHTVVERFDLRVAAERLLGWLDEVE